MQADSYFEHDTKVTPTYIARLGDVQRVRGVISRLWDVEEIKVNPFALVRESAELRGNEAARTRSMHQ